VKSDKKSEGEKAKKRKSPDKGGTGGEGDGKKERNELKVQGEREGAGRVDLGYVLTIG